jgi:hypothetical protein
VKKWGTLVLLDNTVVYNPRPGNPCDITVDHRAIKYLLNKTALSPKVQQDFVGWLSNVQTRRLLKSPDNPHGDKNGHGYTKCCTSHGG